MKKISETIEIALAGVFSLVIAFSIWTQWSGGWVLAGLGILSFGWFMRFRMKEAWKKFKYIVAVFVFIGCMADICAGLWYINYCQDKIEPREHHLISAAEMIAPPSKAEKIRESMLQKMISRTYITYYRYDGSQKEVFQYYRDKLLTMGYEVDWRGKILRGRKDEIIVKIAYREQKEGNEISVMVLFNDIFEKLRIFE